MITISKSVNFGSSKGGLSTVGYTLKNYDGSEQQARTTSGVTEIVTNKGIYGASISFPDTFSGFLVWDTGGGSPVYAVENFDYRNFTATTGSGSGGFIIDVWNDKEKKKLISDVKKILDIVKSISGKDNGDVLESINNLREINRVGETKLKEFLDSGINRLEERVGLKEADIEILKSYMTKISEAMETMLDFYELQQSLEEVNENVPV